MKKLPIQTRTLALLVVLVPLLLVFIYVAMRSGPLAPQAVILASVENRSLSPALFGIGSVEARYTYSIGPTFAGRVKNLEVHVGDSVQAGQVLGEMDPVDMDQRLQAQQAALKRAEAQLTEAQARQDYAQAQARRYAELLKARNTSEELAASKQHELQLATAGLSAAREELTRVSAEHAALTAQRRHLSLIAPVDALVVSREVEPGTTVVAGQTVIELIDPDSLWVNVRFDQVRAHGLVAGLPARVSLRSQNGESHSGQVLRVEPLADVVTEEILAKVVFNQRPNPLPPIGELAEVTVDLPALAAMPVIPNAAIQRLNGQLGVWRVNDEALHYTPVTLGISDLDGQVQVLEGLSAGDRVVVYSEKALTGRSRIKVVEQLPGIKP